MQSAEPSASLGPVRLLAALEDLAQGSPDISDPVVSVLCALRHSSDFAWIVSSAYWHLLNQDTSAKTGIVFTPPELAGQAVNQLRPDLPVVDLGAGTGMLSLTAARFGHHVIAVEQDVHLLRVLRALAILTGLENRINLIQADALAFEPTGQFQIISNPPYSRHHHIAPELKAQLSQSTSEAGVPLPLSSSHYAYFMVHAWKVPWSLQEIFIVPTTWLETRYGRPLREFLRSANIQSTILETNNGKSSFEHAQTTTCIVITKKNYQTYQSKGDNSLTDKTWPQMVGKPNKNFVPLSHYLTVHRGIATGANSFFVLTPETANSAGLSDGELKPVLKRLFADGTMRTALLWVPKQEPTIASLARIRSGEQLRVNERYLCRTRSPWWHIRTPAPPDFLLSYMGRRFPTIVENKYRLLNLNNIHGLYLSPNISPMITRRVITWLQSATGREKLMNSARHYAGGLWKLEPGDISKILVPRSVASPLASGDLPNTSTRP